MTMDSNNVIEAAIFSLNDLFDACEYVDRWAVERFRLHPIFKDASTVDALAKPLFSKAEILLAFEATLDNMILDGLN